MELGLSLSYRRTRGTIWIANAHRDGKRFIVRADEKLTAVLETLIEVGGELIDLLLQKSESQESWKSLLEELWKRGLRGAALKLIVTDGNAGLVKALSEVWPRAGHQRCWVHKLGNLQIRLKASQRACLQEAKLLYQADSEQEAIARFRKWERRWQRSAPRAVHCLEADMEEFSIFRLPPVQRRRLRTSNVIE